MLDRGKNIVSRLGPSKRLRVDLVLFDEGSNGGVQGSDGRHVGLAIPSTQRVPV
jgi:hypothetical protein